MPTNNHPEGWFAAYDRATSEAVRLTTIQLLGLIAIVTGVLVALTAPSTGPSFFFMRQLFAWPWLYGAVLALGGVGQLVGVEKHYPRWVMYSCAWVSLWYALFGGMFLATWLWWFLEHPTGLEPSLYPLGVYLGLSMLHASQGLVIRKKIQAKHTQAILGGEL